MSSFTFGGSYSSYSSSYSYYSSPPSPSSSSSSSSPKSVTSCTLTILASLEPIFLQIYWACFSPFSIAISSPSNSWMRGRVLIWVSTRGSWFCWLQLWGYHRQVARTHRFPWPWGWSRAQLQNLNRGTATCKQFLVFEDFVLRFDAVWWNFDHLRALFLLQGLFGVGFAVVIDQSLDTLDGLCCRIDGLVEAVPASFDNSIDLNEVEGLLNLLVDVEGEEGGGCEREK